MNIYNTLLVLTVSIIIGCNTPKKLIIPEKSEIFVSLKKSSCFGRCAVYTIDIYDNGTGLYNGIRNVDEIGISEFNISDGQKLDLVQSFEQSNFENMDSTYLSNLSDLQVITLTYKSKEVKFHNRRASQKLKELIIMVDEIYLNTK